MSDREPRKKNAGDDELELDDEMAKFIAGVRASKSAEAAAFRPLTAAQREAIVESVLGRVAEGAPADPEATSAAPVDAKPQQHRAPVIPSSDAGVADQTPAEAAPPRTERTPSRPRGRALAAVLVAAVLVAGAVLWGLRPPPAPPSPPADSLSYAIQLRKPARDRSDEEGEIWREGERLDLRPSTRVRIEILPSKPRRDAPQVRVVFVRAGSAVVLDPPLGAARGGAARIDAEAHEVLGEQPNGSAKIVVISGARLPDDEAIKQIALDPDRKPDGVELQVRDVTLVDWGARLEPDVARCLARVRLAGRSELACEVKEGTEIRLWAAIAKADASLSIDGRTLAIAGEPIKGGTRWIIPVPSDARELTLAVRDRTWKLPFKRAETSAALELADRAESDAAEEAALLAAATDPRPEVALAADRRRARLLRLRQAIREAQDLLRKTASVAHDLGRLSDEMKDRYLACFMAIEGDGGAELDVCTQAFATSGLIEQESAEHRAIAEYHRGLAALGRTYLGSAQNHLEHTQQIASRLGLADVERGAALPLAEVYAVMGRPDGAWEQIVKVVDQPADGDCDKARVRTTRGWIKLLLAADDAAVREAYMDLDLAVKGLGSSTCGPTIPWVAWANLAFAEVRLNRYNEAEQHMARARSSSRGENRELDLWYQRLVLAIALARDPARAERLAEELERRALGDSQPEVAFEAAFARARARDVRGRKDDAATAYETAAGHLTAWAAADTKLGKEAYFRLFARHDELFVRWVDLAVRRAESERGEASALEVASVIRASLSAFGQAITRSREPSLKALPRDPSVHALYVHPIENEWVAVLVPPSGPPAMRRVGALRAAAWPAELSALVLNPFAGLLGEARALNIYVHRLLAPVAFEMLPFKGGTLQGAMPVGYGLGLVPVAPSAAAEPIEAGPYILVVSNPTRDLEGAVETRKIIDEVLPGAARVIERDAATREAVIQAMADPKVRILQYDGHAAVHEAPGTQGSQGAMKLANGLLTASDILNRDIVPRVPEIVVLSACQSGWEDGLGLARAFLLRGARQVLAAREKVPDTVAATWMRALYSSAPPARDRGWDLAAAMRAVPPSLAVHPAGSEVGANSASQPFRVLIR